MKAAAATGLLAAVLWTSAGMAQSASPAAEPPGAASPGAAPASPSSPAPAPAVGGGAPAAPPVAAPVASAPPAPPGRDMAVSAIVEKELLGPSGEDLGTIEKVVEGTADQKRYLVVSSGGVLGFFEDEVVVPLDRVVVRNDRIAVRDLTREQVRAMPEFDADRYRDLGGSQRVTLAEGR